MANDFNITDLIEEVGCRHLCPVSELFNDNKIHKRIREESILYRWWFPQDSPIMDYLCDYAKNHAEVKYMIKHGLRKIKIGKRYYFALYLGKSDRGRTRFSSHVKGPENDSTLRRTIRAILTLMKDKECNSKKRIDDILTKCYFEWTEFLGEDGWLIDCFEVMAIAIGCYPLNLDDNPSASKGWASEITKKRKEIKDIPIIK